MDEKEKEEMFGIFSKYPEKLMVLPGLKPVLSTFIRSVEKLKIPTIETPIAKKNNNKTKRSNEKHSSPSSMEVIEPLVRKLCSWLKKQKHFKTNFVILKERMKSPDLMLGDTFSLVPSTSPIGVVFTCNVCRKTVTLQIKTTGSIMVSNTHKHYLRRWLKDIFNGNPPSKSH